MKFCISFSLVELKYIYYCFFLFIMESFIYYFFFDDKDCIIKQHYLLQSFCRYLGYLLNFIPAWIVHMKINIEEKPIINKSIKDFLIFFFICIIVLLAHLISNIKKIIDDNDNMDDKKYSDDCIFLKFLIIFLVSKLYNEVHYKHQKISFFILILIEVIKTIYFFNKKLYHISYIIIIILNIIYSIITVINYFYLKGLMEYKFISPAKCIFMIGIINVPLIILIYFIISFTPLGNINNDYYYDNIFELFKKIGNIDAKNIIILILLPLIFGILYYLLIKTIYEYTIFHLFIPFIVESFMKNIIKNLGKLENFFLEV